MRAIDADKIPYTMLYKEDWLKGSGCEAQGAWKKDIDAMPTIEPERKTGRWIRNQAQTPWPICSECGVYGANESNYCPGCGAKMEDDYGKLNCR